MAECRAILMAPKPVAGGQASGDVPTSVPHRHGDSQTEDGLLVLKRHMLGWLTRYDCSRRAKGDSGGCIPGMDTLIRRINEDTTNLVSHLFHACLVKILHDTCEFDVERVEESVRAENGKKAVADIRLRDGAKANELAVLFIETQYGKSKFDHKMDDLRKARSGSVTADMADNMQAMLDKLLGQLPRGRGFLINYATGTERMMPPLIEKIPNTKCVITVRSNMQAYIYGQSDFKYVEDARRICHLLGWNPNNVLGERGPDQAVVGGISATVTAKASVRVFKKP